MTNMGRNGVRQSRTVRRQHDRQRRRAGAAVGAATLATVAALGVAQANPGQAHAAPDFSLPSPTGTIGDVISALANNGVTQELAEQWRFDLCSSDSDGGPASGGADCTGSTGAGVALVMPTSIDLVPADVYDPLQSYLNTEGGNVVTEGLRQLAIAAAEALGVTVDPVPDAPLPEGSARVIGDGVQFALASGGGSATSAAYLPLSLATSGASDGRTAFAFAVVGMANAWTTSAIPVTIFTVSTDLEVPEVAHVSCYGGLTGAYAQGVGACANVLGTFDFRWKEPNGEVQFGLTDPSAVLFDPADVLGQVLTQVLEGQPLTLSKDVARLSVAGDYDLLGGNFFRLTSDYGPQESTSIDWLGQTLTFHPMVTVNGQERPNHLGVPVLTFGELDTGEIVPVLHLPEFEFPFGIGATGPAFAVAEEASSDAAAEALASSTSTAETTAYVGRHRAPEPTASGYVGAHRADTPAADTPAADTAAADTTASATTSDGGGDVDDAGQADATEPADHTGPTDLSDETEDSAPADDSTVDDSTETVDDATEANDDVTEAADDTETTDNTASDSDPAAESSDDTSAASDD
ncbi:hypothetical protein VZC37_12740 [Gordonia sp. LSe1-13]|uniref:PE-PPE domain-containing protein n=1 Tax=Gordonia sesuvii TaxID=3116777 RepID=A0ABU7MDP7_9ACTN|nr:hypothetical protein [Gordonia sp. LSe1-13]